MSEEGAGPVSIHDVISRTQLNWSNEREPIVTVQSGAELTLAVPDASAGQIGAGAGIDAVTNIDFDKVNPTCGPIHIEGARPGDVLAIEILRMDMSAHGWTAIFPGFGLLADQFASPWLKLWEIGGDGRAAFGDGISVPLQPFCGVIGLAPAEPGVHSVVPPRRVGGNMDVKQLGVGATLYLPVEVEGGLLGIGDTHAAQGDGEVCGTAIESPAMVTVRLSLRPDMDVDAPEFDVTRPLERPEAGMSGYHATTGVAPDLMAATRQAIERMIVYLTRRFRLEPEEAYALCSVAVDLRISEVVDAPNWVVSAFLPNDLVR
ncbi:MAG: acetamidase/formamidase family protein [Candidatus Dormibacteraeota bacterium]|uniref:Acetamidase/formamidase family protein n=1 Tax=Candidatus Dormiibacter inghamiae TaxID=3127013 RepID=A0A934K7S5_9BACT|nr:acetamidase/formamidase family protein [Candidatus Dormibacteraeota bacterium]MBJ7606498.1 acetamidase/formamidase family protein [Candidatus Dormibacteraeota bacterium]